MVFLPKKMNNLNLIIRRHQKIHQGTFYKRTGLYSSTLSGYKRQRLRNSLRLKETRDMIPNAMCDPGYGTRSEGGESC